MLAFGWVEEQIRELFGAPDAQKVEGGDAFGGDRVLFAALVLVAGGDDSPRGARARLWLDGLESSEAEAGQEVALPIKLEGFPWLGLCRSANAEEGQELLLCTRRGEVPIRVAEVHGSWQGFGLVKVTRV